MRAMVAAATLADRCYQRPVPPDKQIDLIDEAGVGMRICSTAPPDLREFDEKTPRPRRDEANRLFISPREGRQ